MSKYSIAIAAMVVLTLVLVTAAMAADPFVGTWKTNVANSQLGTNPAPKSNVSKIQAGENGLKMEQDIVDADGKGSHREFSWMPNGKDFPYPPYPALAMNCTRPDTHSITCILKTKDGKEAGRIENVLSKDGKTWTVTTTGRTAKGEAVHEVVVNERK
jgi:hypothetical protein